MRLADRVAQCRDPFIVKNTKDGSVTRLNGATTFSKDIGSCATRYVLSDELTRLCTALAYSKGASTLACADLLHVPAERVWVEWTEAPWRDELARYGFKSSPDSTCLGRRGVFIQSTPQGRRGLLKTFWASGESEASVLSSSMEAYFDFDTREGEDPEVFGRRQGSSICVSDDGVGEADILRRCFRFRFERSWQDYYERAKLTSVQATAVTHHALGTIAIDIPVLLAFLQARRGVRQSLFGHDLTRRSQDALSQHHREVPLLATLRPSASSERIAARSLIGSFERLQQSAAAPILSENASQGASACRNKWRPIFRQAPMPALSGSIRGAVKHFAVDDGTGAQSGTEG